MDTLPSPAGECALPPFAWGGGRGTLTGERGGGRVPIPTRGHTLWYSVYICTLWLSGNLLGTKVKSTKILVNWLNFFLFGTYLPVQNKIIYNFRNLMLFLDPGSRLDKNQDRGAGTLVDRCIYLLTCT